MEKFAKFHEGRKNWTWLIVTGLLLVKRMGTVKNVPIVIKTWSLIEIPFFYVYEIPAIKFQRKENVKSDAAFLNSFSFA